MNNMSMINKQKISLFIPCLVDQVYPEIGIDMAKILDHFGYQVTYNSHQTCCGQPAFNAGHRDEARKVASKFIEVFASSDIIVSPSGSCTAMVKNYYSTLFVNESLEGVAVDLGKKIFEFSEFLARENQIKNITGNYSGKVGFHNSCHSYRELGIDQEPLEILKKIKGLKLIQLSGEPVCCGFGGLFSFKFDEIAATMAKTRLEMFTSLNVETIVTNDPGCLMHMRQESIDRNYKLNLLHLTELLAQALKL
jgi:L-lactate dehydrogenase complex protein LldE